MKKCASLPGLVGGLLWLLAVGVGVPSFGQAAKPGFRVVAMAEPGSVHAPFVAAAQPWLQRVAAEEGFTIDCVESAAPINEAFLAQYQLFIHLDYPPYRWSDTAKAALQTYIEAGHGAWIGFHHASLLGEFDGYPTWPWFSDFLGGIRYTNYIARFATATVRVEAATHPCLQGVPATFAMQHKEWYTYDQSPRPKVAVLATVGRNHLHARLEPENGRPPRYLVE